ncbi:unnamed protein product [Prorocentrum cordatum]|uniref:Uncharacterized protein n=1 Tax=Prorocentrum cordatum TaxID=2364126 RepID=A0ABN9XZA3_9DINO|nr:unnamed protein product [Polarella glacialis]
MGRRRADAGWLAAERPPLGLPEGPAANLAHSPAADHVATREAGAVQLAAQTPRSARSAGARSAGVRKQDGKIGSSLRAAGQASGATSSATAPQRRLAGSRSEPPDPSEPLSEASGGASPRIMNARTSSQCISTVQGVFSANDAETRPVSSRSSSDSARALRQSVLQVALLAASQTAAAPAAHPQLAAGSAAEPAASAPLLPTASWPPYRAEHELFLGP